LIILWLVAGGNCNLPVPPVQFTFENIPLKVFVMAGSLACLEELGLSAAYFTALGQSA
jgi:hypothetical protein